MKLHRILILGAAAWAGSLLYNHFHPTMPVVESESGGTRNFYSDVTGPGSLMATIKAAKAQRDEPAKSAPATGGSPVSSDDMALLQASAKGDETAVQKRLAAHAKVDSRDNQRRTPLMYAAAGGYDGIAARLLAGGANIEFRDRDGFNALDYAAGRGLTEHVRFLLAHAHAEDDRHYIEFAILIHAALTGDAGLLPEDGGKLSTINRLTPEGQSALAIAAGNGSLALTQILIRRGADVNLVNEARQTPLHWAAWNNQAAMIGLLAEAHADLSARDWNGDTPLILAARHNSFEATRALLEGGADKDAADKEGKTAFMTAQDKGFSALADVLK